MTTIEPLAIVSDHSLASHPGSGVPNLLADPHRHGHPPDVHNYTLVTHRHNCETNELIVPLAESHRHRDPSDVHRHRRRVLGGAVQPGSDGTPHQAFQAGRRNHQV